MKKSLLLTLGFISSLMFVTTTFAETKISVTSTGDSEVSVNNNIKSSSSTSITSNSSSNINISTSGGGDNQVKIENNKFEIKGKITSIDGSSFTVNNQKIELNSAKITGTMQVNKNIEVKGSIVNSKLLAEEIFVENSSTPIQSPQATSSANPSTSPDGEIKGESTNSGEIKVEAKGPIEQVIQVLENILNSLKNLL